MLSITQGAYLKTHGLKDSGWKMELNSSTPQLAVTACCTGSPLYSASESKNQNDCWSNLSARDSFHIYVYEWEACRPS